MLPAPQVLLVQLEPLALAQAVQQALQALAGSQVHLVQQALKERRAFLEPLELLALLVLRAQMGLQAQLAFKGPLE